MSHPSDPPTPGRPSRESNGIALDGRRRGFVKGKSGNPGGLTKAAAAMRRIVPTMISELTHGGADLVMLLLRIASGAEPGMDDARSRAWAIRELLDRNLGRPALALKLEAGGDADMPSLDDRDLTDDELRVLSKLDIAVPVPAKVLKLVPTTATEAPPDDHGGS